MEQDNFENETKHEGIKSSYEEPNDILSHKTQEICKIDGSAITNSSDIVSHKTKEISDIDGSEITNSSDIVSHKTQEISEIEGNEITNSSDILSHKAQEISELDGSEVTNISNQGGNQGTKHTSKTKSKKGGQNKDKPLRTKV